MRIFIYITLSTLLVVTGGLYILGWNMDDLFQLKGERDQSMNHRESLEFENELSAIIEDLENGEKSEVFNDTVEELIQSGPLIGRGEPDFSTLSKEGVVFWTNKHRTESGLNSLNNSDLLNSVAQERMLDMFRYQYFDHVSPQGVEASHVAQENGYQYIVIGENIALGNFPDDETLVEAWMDSPGHRENILSSSFTEIGVAASQGSYEGSDTWISVQIFGRPLSDCPQPNQSLSLNIDNNKELIEILELEMKDIQAQIDESQPGSFERAEWTGHYNALVEEINPVILETKELIEDFNAQVFAFNACLEN